MSDEIRSDRPTETRPADAAVDRELELKNAEMASLAAHEAVRRDIAEAQAADARISAGQAWQAADELAVDRNILDSQLAHERAAASNASFGFYLTLAILFVALLVGGFYLYNQSQNPNSVVVNAASPPTSPTPVVVAPSIPSAPSPPPVTVNTPPPIVNVTPSSGQPSTDNEVRPSPSDSNSDSGSTPSGSSDGGAAGASRSQSAPQSGNGG